MSIEPDTKDWTWVLAGACPECGFDTPALDRDRVPAAIRDNATLWESCSAPPTRRCARRPTCGRRWSTPVTCATSPTSSPSASRLMLEEDDPPFANWDQDETARTERLRLPRTRPRSPASWSTPRSVPRGPYESVRGDQWQRPGTRSNGDRFTVETLAGYHLHDLVHHAHDVSHVTKRVTVGSYDAAASAYAEATATVPEQVRAAAVRFATDLPAGARVLEVGSGPGRDARLLE